MNSRTCEPRMYTRSRWVTLPSRWVTLMFSICTFMLSSAVARLANAQALPYSILIVRTLYELAAVSLAGGDLNRHLVALRACWSATYPVSARPVSWTIAVCTYGCFIEQLDRDADCGSHGGGIAVAYLEARCPGRRRWSIWRCGTRLYFRCWSSFACESFLRANQ